MKINKKIIRLKQFIKSNAIVSEAQQSRRMNCLKAREPISLLLALTIILSIFLVAVPMAGIAEATDYYVDPNGTNDASHGTSTGTDAFKTIQYAINDSRVVAGDTINVAAGTYDEQVVITKSLTLQGAGDTTIIKPSSFAKLTNFYSVGTRTFYPFVVATTTGGSVTMKDFMVDGSLVTPPTNNDRILGVHYRETGGVIDNVDVQHIRADNVNKGGDGILALAESNAVTTEIKNCEVTDWDKGGIWAQGNKQIANIHDNIVTGRGSLTDEVQNAIQIAYGATGTVTNNQVSNVAYTGAGYWTAYGIIFGDASGTATGNTLTNCQAGIGAEAPLANSHTVTIDNNTISATGLIGVPNIFGINVCTGNSTATIDATIENNNLSAGGPGKGIKIGETVEHDAVGTVNATIEGNSISNWQHGIWLGLTSNNVTINGNTITNNTEAASGIHINANVDVSNISAHFNNIEENQGYGVYNGGTGILDATNNWWGDASGPSGGVADPVTGKIADGTGDAVSDNVKFDPFLSPNVTITKTGPATANQGNNITYTITYKNMGTFNATNVVITETYPSEVSYVSATPAPDSGTNNQWTIPTTLAPGAEGTITVTVHIK
jgi:uncharacterized repeat protein (TIGR01451 family)